MKERIMVKNFIDENQIKEEDLLAIIHDFIEESVLKRVINDFIDEDVNYLKVKNRELRWLATKSRFRAQDSKM
jgi:hypothetical protein